MKYSGVIFDFNGTLFWDTPLHNKAWNMFLEKRGMHLSDHEFFATFHGKNNRDIFNSLFQREHSAEEIRALVDEKETLYRHRVLLTSSIFFKKERFRSPLPPLPTKRMWTSTSSIWE